MKKLIYLTCLLISFQLFSQEAYFASSPSLTPDASKIVFSYDADLWIVESKGGEARRLTAMEGTESFPRISPDGKWVAFTAEVMGNADIYLMPIGGGEITRLTYHSSADRTETWSWDSKTIYFRSSRMNRVAAYSVSIEGGTPQRLVDHYFNWPHNLAIHPDGRIFFNESWESSNQVTRKRYKGSFNPDIKTYHPKTGDYEELTSYEGKDMWSTIDKNGNVYFVSDRDNGQYNLFALTNGVEQRTNFGTSIKDPQISADGSLIVFEKDYQIFTYNTSTNVSDKVPINVLNHSMLAADQEYNTKDNVGSFDISPDQKKMAFVSRGALFVSDISGKFIKQLSTHTDERVVEVKWLNDNETLLFTQTVNGYPNIFKINAKTDSDLSQLTNEIMFTGNIELNPDMTTAAYFSGINEVRLMNLENFESTTIAREELWGLYNPQPRFSPDGKMLTFTVRNDFEEDIYLYQIENKTLTNLTKTGVPETNPFWGPDGKYIYFETNRTSPSYPFGLQEGDIYRIPLQRQEEPFKSSALEEVFEDKEGEKDGEKTLSVRIDPNLDPVEAMERVGASFGSQSQPFVVKKGNTTHVLYYSNHDESRTALWVTSFSPFESSKTEKLAGTGNSGGLIQVDDDLYLNVRGTINKLDLGSKKLKPIPTEFKFRKSLRKEFDQMFFETWAGVQENFYNEDFHEMDWDALKDQYAEYLPYIKSRAELRVLLNDLLGELNSSHMGFRSGGPEERNTYRASTASLGLTFYADEPYKVKSIITDGPFDFPGKALAEGDELIAINGLEVDPSINRNYYLTNTSIDQEIEVTFRSGKENKTFKVHPQSTGRTSTNLYDEWVDHNQTVVDQQTDKKVAYVHMKNMSGGELQNFLLEMTSEGYNRDGLILDLRYNTGGNVHDEVLKFLSQKPYLQWKYREGKLTTQGNFGAGAKPTVLLINEQSLSDAEMTAQGFKALGLGTIIGTETYRWIIFTSGASLVDGSFYRLPSWGCYTLEGENLEKTGVAPDIFVKTNFQDRIEGKDPQLERAIQEVLSQLNK
jgi:tricorn protease